MSSPTSSDTPAQIIDRILRTDTNTPDYLKQLVTNIDVLLDHYTNKGKQTATDGKLASVRAGLPSPLQVAKFSDEASKSVGLISTQISGFSGDKHSTAISVLNAIGSVHWVGVGFLLVATVIERMDKIKQNKEECLGLLKSMNDLAKLILQLRCFPHLKKEMQDKMNESIQRILDGAILCCLQKKRKLRERLWVAGKDGEELAKLRSQVDEMGGMLHKQISLSTLDVVHSNMICSQPRVPYHNPAVVGIDHKIKEVMELLEWDNDEPAVAVVVHGIGGAGKTTLANEVFASLNRQGWKYSKVTLVKNWEFNPDIEKIQSQILSDLTGIKHDTVRDFQDGQQQLKSIMGKEDVFIYIDNILRKQHLENLLPKLIDSPKKVRILVTARKTNICGVFESCRFKLCKLYSIESLSVEAALEVLCRKIDSEKDIAFMVEERPQAKEIAKKCSCCPLFLEVVGAYLHKRNNKVEAYENVFGWLREGKDFSCDKEDGFEESRILFAYHELTPSAQEAFLDICSFFYDWEWNEVACIVGEEELDCLLEGALVKRIEVESYAKCYYGETRVERISIHDLILSAGRNKSKGDRYRSLHDISLAMESGLDLHQTKGIMVKYSNKPFHVSAEVLESMRKYLRVLVLGYNTIVSGQCSKRFDELRILQASELPNMVIDILQLKNLCFMDYRFKENEICSLPKHFSGLQVLKLSKNWRTDINAEIEFGHLIKLKHLELTEFHFTEVSSFVKVCCLQKLKLSSIKGLKELPGSIGKLRSLKELYLLSCDELMRFEEGFGELSSLIVLDLTNSSSLQELPCDSKKLLSLQSLILLNCRNLLGLPEEIENLPSLKFVNVERCSMLTSLPHKICQMSLQKNTRSLTGCKSLKVLPVGFGQFSWLESLYLNHCESLQELCDDFHCLARLKKLNMCRCKNLTRLPEGFGQLGCLERLELSECDNIQELCSDFGCLGALKYLNLSKCKSLSKLPDCFGHLGCLETLNLSMCFKLEALSSDFHCLASLIKLDLSNCESLGEKWMDNVGSIQSLWCLNISRSEKMIRRWIEMQREKEDWNFVVLTDFSWKETEEGRKALLLKLATSKIFDEEGLLIDIHGRPFYSSSLPPTSSLVFIIEDAIYSHIDGKLFEKCMQQLELNSRACIVIYAGRHFSALPSEVTNRIMAYTPSSSKIFLLFREVFAEFPQSHTRYRKCTVFRSRVGLEGKGIKCPSVWEDVSYILNEAAFLTRAPSESNVEILKAMLQTDILLKKNGKVKLMDLQGKVILLLNSSLDMCERRSSVINDMYMKMQGSHHNLVEAVWVPHCREERRDLFERVAKDAPWPVVPNPWLIKESLQDFFSLIEVPFDPWSSFPTVVVVDGKGRISNKKAWEMIGRWGEEAFPFSQDREEELRKSEWEKMYNYNQFVFRSLPFSQTEVKEGSPSGEMLLLFVGGARDMLEFSAEAEYALTKLKSHFQLYYIWNTYAYWIMNEKTLKAIGEMMIKAIGEMSTIPSISLFEADRFWERIKYLYNDLTRMGSDEKIVGMRSMVFDIISAEVGSIEEEEIRVMVVDEKGEMVSGRGKEVVEALSLWPQIDSKLPTQLDIGGIRQVLEGQKKDGIIYSNHHPHHLMLKLCSDYHPHRPRCSMCSKKTDYYYHQCNVCENHVMCNECISK